MESMVWVCVAESRVLLLGCSGDEWQGCGLFISCLVQWTVALLSPHVSTWDNSVIYQEWLGQELPPHTNPRVSPVCLSLTLLFTSLLACDTSTLTPDLYCKSFCNVFVLFESWERWTPDMRVYGDLWQFLWAKNTHFMYKSSLGMEYLYSFILHLHAY